MNNSGKVVKIGIWGLEGFFVIMKYAKRMKLLQAGCLLQCICASGSQAASGFRH